MDDLTNAINRLAEVGERLIVALEGPDEESEPVRLVDDVCPTCEGEGAIDGQQCRTCVGRGRIRVT